ncbi:MAG: addiction module protein [Bergeyella sp.]
MDNVAILRNRVLEFVGSANETILKKISEIIETENEPTEAQKRELDKRLERYSEGKTKFFTLEEVEAKLAETK